MIYFFTRFSFCEEIQFRRKKKKNILIDSDVSKRTKKKEPRLNANVKMLDAMRERERGREGKGKRGF